MRENESHESNLSRQIDEKNQTLVMAMAVQYEEFYEWKLLLFAPSPLTRGINGIPWASTTLFFGPFLSKVGCSRSIHNY